MLGYSRQSISDTSGKDEHDREGSNRMRIRGDRPRVVVVRALLNFASLMMKCHVHVARGIELEKKDGCPTRSVIINVNVIF